MANSEILLATKVMTQRVKRNYKDYDFSAMLNIILIGYCNLFDLFEIIWVVTSAHRTTWKWVVPFFLRFSIFLSEFKLSFFLPLTIFSTYTCICMLMPMKCEVHSVITSFHSSQYSHSLHPTYKYKAVRIHYTHILTNEGCLLKKAAL